MDVKRILVIRYRRVGDSIVALSLLRTLRMNFPEAVIDFVIDANIAALHRGNPDIDHLIEFTHEEKHSPLRYLRKVWSVMRRGRYDVVIDMRATIQTLWFSLFSPFSRFRIGRRKPYNWLALNRRVEVPRDEDMVRQNMALLRPLCEVKPIKECRDFRVPVDEGERIRFREYMERQGVDFSRPVVLAAVATRIPWKAYEKGRMEEVLRRLIEKYDAQLILNFGGKEEEEYAESVRADLGGDPHIFTSVRAENLKELVWMIANCDFFFGNEGGPRHLAHALGVPSFAIYPPHISKRVWLPENDGSHQGIAVSDVAGELPENLTYEERFALITVDSVWKRLDGMLESRLGKSVRK